MLGAVRWCCRRAAGYADLRAGRLPPAPRADRRADQAEGGRDFFRTTKRGSHESDAMQACVGTLAKALPTLPALPALPALSRCRAERAGLAYRLKS